MLRVTAGETNTVDDADDELYEAMSVRVCAVLPEALALNEAVDSPADTWTVDGIFKAEFPPDTETVAPPDGAAIERVTVHGADVPLGIMFGVQASDETVGAAFTEIVAEA